MISPTTDRYPCLVEFEPTVPVDKRSNHNDMCTGGIIQIKQAHCAMCVTVQLAAAKHRTAAGGNIIPLLPHCFCVGCLMLATVLTVFHLEVSFNLTACECLREHSSGRDVIEWRTEI